MIIDWFATIKRFYDAGLWPIEWVKDAVRIGTITEAEYEEITGEVYAE